MPHPPPLVADLTPRPRLPWRLPRGTLQLGDRTLLMGILNLTPDSFSDGGRFPSPSQDISLALTHALILLDHGADLLDLGAESTRPNATPLSAADEIDRLLPLLRDLRRARPNALLSIDTYHAETALRALDAGADLINDVSGLAWDPDLLPALAHRAAHPDPFASTAHPAGLVLMHTRGRPTDWTTLPPLAPAETLPLVRAGLAETLARATAAGLHPDSLVLDPGFGFGKRADENLPLLNDLASLHSLGRPLLIGLSRKRFLTSHPSEPTDDCRLHATIAANTAAILAGAHILRVHDIAAARAAADLADRLLNCQPLAT